jgi:hypothetical protein
VFTNVLGFDTEGPDCKKRNPSNVSGFLYTSGSRCNARERAPTFAPAGITVPSLNVKSFFAFRCIATV